MKLAVIDVETTGLNPIENRITEIGIVFIDRGEIISTYESLINPGVHIPEKIQLLTGITNKMVKQKPSFADVAELIEERIKDHVIVGHHVNFDYSFLKNEMKLAGISFTRKTLCTVELTKYLYHDFNSYSLSSLCRIFKLKNRRPHRALPDAEVTADLIRKLLESKSDDFLEDLLGNKTNTIPDHLQETIFNELPTKPGVYYFMGKNNKPVYIGKAANIKNRVLSHFRGEGNSLKILSLGAKINKIQFKETGNELLAMLLEDHEIRHYWPPLNRAQKKNTVRFGVVAYMDQSGRWRLNIASSGKIHCFIAFFHQYHLAADYIRSAIIKYNLNGSLCGIGDSNECDQETHQINFIKMMDDVHSGKFVEIYYGKGRKTQEKSFVWVENSAYRGFGYVDSGSETDENVLMSNLSLRFSSVTSENIIRKLRETAQPGHSFPMKNPGQSQGFPFKS